MVFSPAGQCAQHPQIHLGLQHHLQTNLLTKSLSWFNGAEDSPNNYGL